MCSRVYRVNYALHCLDLFIFQNRDNLPISVHPYKSRLGLHIPLANYILQEYDKDAE
jgi:hypothetical protein